MKPVLTTILPYWGRPEMLDCYIKAMEAATDGLTDSVQHIVYFVGEPVLSRIWKKNWRCYSTKKVPGPGLSIGHYHNLGAIEAKSEWIMKSDVDTIPNIDFFEALLPVLANARPREWFNVGMLYLDLSASIQFLNRNALPLTVRSHKQIIAAIDTVCSSSYKCPAGTNFVCNREDYIKLGGCHSNFRGYGWEDYQQIYMLERHWRQACPLGGRVDMSNVTRRCRDEISRPKAMELWNRDPLLCLMHHWHPAASPNPEYKSKEVMDNNKQILLDYITQYNRTEVEDMYHECGE